MPVSRQLTLHSLAWLIMACGNSLANPASSSAHDSVTLLFWNLQNAFDDRSDGDEYPEYDPSQSSWNSALFRLRTRRYAQVLNRYPEVDVLVFAELENERVLHQIQRELDTSYAVRLVTSKRNYARMGVLSRLPVVETRQIDSGWWQKKRLRPIFAVKLQGETAPLWLFINHWKSKRNGVQRSEGARIQASQRLSQALARLLRTQPAAEVIVVGDFNESHNAFQRAGYAYPTALMPWSRSQQPTLLPLPTGIWLTDRPELAGVHQGKVVLFSPWFSQQKDGSYFYRNSWQSLDQFMLGPGLFDQQGYVYRSMEVLQPRSMVDAQGRPQAWRLHSTQGYADHLPIALNIVPG